MSDESKLQDAFAGYLMTFNAKRDDGDTIDEGAVLVELCDRGEEVEFGFTAERSNRRIYIRMKLADLKEAVRQSEEPQACP